MKIPETSANVGAYYGNEENGQWQPNGVLVDNGVGGGVVGSGDAGVHRGPVYPVHIPRGHIPGYVMAGAFYPPAPYGVPPAAAPQDAFEDYMWMENEEEFDKQVMQQLEEEALMEQCIEAMLEDEQRERHRPMTNGHKHHHYPTTSRPNPLSLEETVSRSTLNPLAAEFVPTCARLPPPPAEERQESSESAATATEPTKSVEEPPGVEPEPLPTAEEPPTHTEVPEPPKDTETPEVSAADVPLSGQDKDKRPKEKDSKKDLKETKRPSEPKKSVKPEQKPKPKSQPQSQPVKTESKVQPKRKETKSVKVEVKSETKVEEKVEEAPTVESVKPQPPTEEPIITPGIKPINYAAAAKATKPKKPTTPPIVAEKTPPPAKTEKKLEKKSEKIEKPVQRKNSTK